MSNARMLEGVHLPMPISTTVGRYDDIAVVKISSGACFDKSCADANPRLLGQGHEPAATRPCKDGFCQVPQFTGRQFSNKPISGNAALRENDQPDRLPDRFGN